MFIGSELAYVVPFPVPCSKCENENFEFAAKLVDLEEMTCPSCGAVLDLNTKEWQGFRRRLKRLCVGKVAPVARMKYSS